MAVYSVMASFGSNSVQCEFEVCQLPCIVGV